MAEGKQLSELQQLTKILDTALLLLQQDGVTGSVTGALLAEYVLAKGPTEQLTNLSMVKSGDTITITSTLEGGDTVVDTITLTNGVPTSGVFNGVACTIEMEGF